MSAMDAGRLLELSQSLSGDISVSASGVVTIADPYKVRTQQTSLNATQLAALNSAPQTIVTVQSNKIVFPVWVVINYTFGTAAMTGGPVNLQTRYLTGSIIVTPSISTDNLWSAASSNTVYMLTPSQAGANSIGVVNGSMVGQALSLWQSADLTKGTATGSAVITVGYQIITP